MSAVGPADHMHDHWWWRPGWRVGRTMYAWHITFDDQPQLHEIVKVYQDALSSLPDLDVIPMPWLHLTMQGIAFSDEICEQEIIGIVQAARKRLAAQPPVSLAVGPAIVDSEAIMMHVQPAVALNPVRASVRAAIADVRGMAHVTESEQWTPHISLAYSNGCGLAAPYIEAVDYAAVPPADLIVSAAHLIELCRDTRLYQWVTKAEIPLSG